MIKGGGGDVWSLAQWARRGFSGNCMHSSSPLVDSGCAQIQLLDGIDWERNPVIVRHEIAQNTDLTVCRSNRETSG